MASVCSPRRQLAPTVGPAAVQAGVFIRMGSSVASGERAVSGLVQRLGALKFVSDNAGCIGNKPFPRNGTFINFGGHEVYVATIAPRVYPEVVHVAADPPAVCATRGRRSTHSAGCVEVMATGQNAGTGKGVAGEAEAPARPSRSSKPAYEKPENRTGRVGTTSVSVRPTPLQASIEKLAKPVEAGADPALAQAQLEEQRQNLLHEATEVARVRQELEISFREYNKAHGIISVNAKPSRVDAVRNRGRNLNEEIEDARTEASTSVSYATAERPKYDTPAKYLRAAEAAAAELPNLTGDALCKQQARVQELLAAANRLNDEFAKAKHRADASQVIHSASAAGAKSVGQASSPCERPRRDGSVNYKQMTLYDPVLAGRQIAGQGNVDNQYVGREEAARRNGAQGNANRGIPNAGNTNAGRNRRHNDQRQRNSAGGRLPPRQPTSHATRERHDVGQGSEQQGRARAHNRHDDGYSAMEEAGYGRPLVSERIGDRLGSRQLGASDARLKLDRIYLSELLEEQGPPGPPCFGPRIMKEPAVRNFQLPRGTKTYNGSTKPEDWLNDYVQAVYVAGGNRRWAVRYVPQMLEGPARIWLNNLPAESINCWLDFSETFVNNFTSTYKRPNRPQHLTNCRQKENETDREYLTRWSNIRNSCEGVDESQAISWFAQGCRHGSMLWQRLARDPPATLAETIKIADMYALGDPTQASVLQAEQTRDRRGDDGARRQDRPDSRGKRKEDYPDRRYGSHQVAAVDQDQPEAGGSQRQKTGSQWGGQKKVWNKNAGQKQFGEQKKPWQDRPKYTLEMCMDQPCSFHTPDPRKPANHTTRQCSWMNRVRRGEGLEPSRFEQLPPPPPLTGANAQLRPAQPTYQENRDGDVGVHHVGNNNGNVGNGRNEYKEHHQSYMIFVTEPTDKQSQYRRALEVNAVMPAVPRYMYWSEQEISWSRNDHPKVMPNPGGYALVLDPTLCGPDINVKFSKVLIDNGSSINILYGDSMTKLRIPENMLEPSRTTFHGIIPGVSCEPMGKIRIDVMFGTRENCRTESIQFEVVDLVSPYHALLGRPALSKFMASTHVGYLKMKMPGPNGVITISGNYKCSMECASAGSALAESLVIAEEKRKMHVAVALAQSANLGMPSSSDPQGDMSFKPAKETKSVQLDADFPERTITIGAGLDAK